MNIETVVKMSNTYGSNPELVLAGGGNTSMKTEDIIFVKASGLTLSTITQNGFIKLSRHVIAEIFKKKYPEGNLEREAAVLKDLMSAKIDQDNIGRPSVETLLHSLFAYTYVLHLHPAMVNGLTCSKDGEQLAKKLFGERSIWLEPCRPGYTLAMLCRDRMEKYKKKLGTDVQIVFLQNHGVFFAANTVKEIESLLSGVQKVLESIIIEKPDFRECTYNTDEVIQISKTITSLSKDTTHVIFNGSCTVRRLLVSEERKQSIMKPFTPDHIVYCRAYPLFLEDITFINNEVSKYINYYGYSPRIILLKGVGFFAVGADKRTARLAELLFYDSIKIAVYSQSFGGVLPMPNDLVKFIINWEAEAYRQKQNL